MAGFPQFDDALRRLAVASADPPPAEEAPLHAERFGRVIMLNRQVPTVLGRVGREGATSLSDSLIEPRHCLIAPCEVTGSQTRIGQTPQFYLVDCLSKIGTFVNRRRVTVTRLEPGDFIQIGPFAWSFSAEDGHLVALAPIRGVGISLDGIERKGRLGPDFRLRIEPGTFVAIVGRSGSGKSTVLKMLAGLDGAWATPEVTMLEPDKAEWSRKEELSRFRSLLGYVSQDSVLHERLTPEQLLRTSRRFRRGGKPDTDIDAAIEEELLRFELSKERTQPIFTLSGGENKRLRVASELMGEPRLLILDEPDSGLDRERRNRLMQILRVRSWQGCTVVLVTHDTTDLSDRCDRVIELDRRQVASDQVHKLGVSHPPGFAPDASTASPARQIGILLKREWDLLWANSLQRFGLPVDRLQRLFLPAAVAGLFSLAVGVAVPGGEHQLLGFLAIISVLWMSASLSLLSIAGERAVFDHERHLFLHTLSYLTAKTLAMSLLSSLQTMLFFFSLWAGRTLIGRDFFIDPVRPETFTNPVDPVTFVTLGLIGLTLGLVGWSGIALGLLLSVYANRNKETATYVLPLIMVAQIVFSIPIAEQAKVRDSVRFAYADFHWPECQQCQAVWFDWGDTLCESCRKWLPPESTASTMPTGGRFRLGKNPWAALASYMTISRPADIAIRIQLEEKADPQARGGGWQEPYLSFQIVGWVIALLGLTFVCVQRQHGIR